MEALGNLLIIVALVAAWFLFARFLRGKNVHFVLRHIGGAVVGAFAMVAMVAVLLSTGVIGNNAAEQTATAGPAATTGLEPEAATPEIVQIQEEPSAAPDDIKVSDLGYTPDQFAGQLNAAMHPLELPFTVPASPPITTGQVNDVFNVALNQNIAVIGTVDKGSGNVRSVTLIGTGDGTPASGLTIMTTAVALFMAADNDQSDSGKDAAVQTLMELFDKQEASDTNTASTIRHGLKLTISSPKDLGTWFVVEPEI